jgi:CheY-like chemotaxis protein
LAAFSPRRGTINAITAFAQMIDSDLPVVLIVEDEPLIRMLAVDAFVDHGFLVLEAEHAAEALRVHETQAQVDVLFTDVNMPGALNGIDLAERLKAKAPELRIIITSALPILRPVDHLPARFFSKPYAPHDVCAAAKALLAA